MEHAPSNLMVRIVNGLKYARIESMSALCAKSPDEIRRVRNLGVKSLAVVFRAREQFMVERENAE